MKRHEIGPYRIIRRLAFGERSEVLLARAHGPYGFERTVVLKRLIDGHAKDPQWLRRLAAEAIAYARLSHSAIVRLYDFIELDDTPTLVLEYVPGISLEALLRTKTDRGERLGDPEIIYIGARVFAGLAAAHGARHPETGEFSPVIHRDVSPGNVLVSTHGEVKLSDFGIARVAGVSEKTPSGTLLGTYGYMAPEQIVGDSVTVRADVYGAALLLWEMLAGRHAFDRDSLPELEILQAMAEPRIPPIERLRPDLPQTLCRALGRALRADADERIGARDMLDELRGLVQSADARASLADDLGRARRAVSTIPDAPPVGRAWTAYAAAVDPDATTDHGIAIPADMPEPSSTVPARIRARLDSDTPTAIVAPIPIPIAPTSPHAQSVPPPQPRRSRRFLAYLLATAVVLAPLAGGARPVGQASSTQPRRATRSSLAAAVEGRVDDARTESASPVPADVGILETPDGMANHRVFVDGVVRGTGGQ
ncbi:MAG: serine/threonine-protein kinase, partial [Polyangiaceae bacterium]